MSQSGPGISGELVTLLSQKVVGQPGALRHIVPYIQMYRAGLSPLGRPIGNFLLLGPTGTGKTRTVEVLAEVLHGRHQNYVRIDCGEFQLEHEMAKLIGAPPGYLGHGSTTPRLNQRRLAEVTSKHCDISLVLFDEIEKAAESLTRLLLGVLDKGTLKLGDNSSVNFERSLIFLTSNLGASDMMKEMRPAFGFDAGTDRAFGEGITEKLESIALGAVRRKFSPEFVNRMDAVVTYQPLTPESLAKILEHQIDALQDHVNTRLGSHCFQIQVRDAARTFLIDRGTSSEYGARELKRVMHRFVMQPLATLVAEGRIAAGSRVVVDVDTNGEKLSIQATGGVPAAAARPASRPRLLIVDDNESLLLFLRSALGAYRWEVVTAGTAAEALEISSRKTPSVALIDYMLPDQTGLELSSQLQANLGSLPIIIMTGGQLSPEEQEVCRSSRWLLLQKPFMVDDVIALVEGRLANSASARAAG